MADAIGALERVFGAFDEPYRCSAADVDAAERRLGITFPAALRLLYERTGRHPFHTAQNKLIALEQLGFDGDHLVIYDENQGVCAWGIARDALVSDDPPVDVTVETTHGTKYEREFASVTEFLIVQAAWQASATLPWAGLLLAPSALPGRRAIVTASRMISRDEAAIVGDVLQSSDESEVRARPGVIALVSSDGFFSLAAQDEKTFRELAKALGITDDDWHFLAPRDS